MNIEKTWRKSSYSGAGNNCVELAVGHSSTAVRDTKCPVVELTFADGAFRAFITSLRQT
jgi:Domain of unknown function (DUF397)